MKIGIDLGGSHVAIGLIDDHNEIIEKRTYYMSENKIGSIEDYIVTSIVHGVNEILLNTGKTLSCLEMIGIATPGNPKDGSIKNVVNLGIKEFKIEEKLRESFGKDSFRVPIRLENDGKCAALAEKRYGSLKEYDDCIFLCIGTGIGGAAFLGGKFLKPKRNAGFEFGHMVIKKEGIKCGCGNNGCFEAYCSKKKFKENMQSILKIQEYVRADELIKKINANIENSEVEELLTNYIDDLAIGISNIVNIFEPEAISIGGSMSHYESLIFDKLKDRIYNGKYLFNKENPPKIVAAKIGNDAGILGATLIED